MVFWESLAVSGAWSCLKRVGRWTLGDEHEAALREIRAHAFINAIPDPESDEEGTYKHTADLWLQFLSQQHPSELLLTAVLERKPAPIEQLRSEASKTGLVPDEMRLGGGDFKQILNSYGKSIDSALRAHAVRSDSPLRMIVEAADREILIRGLTQSPSSYANTVRRILDEYVGTAENPVPFGGRKADLERLDDWLDDASRAPYLLLCEGAGSGKSALLAHWVIGLSSRAEAPHLIYVPLSARFGFHQKAPVLQSLASSLHSIVKKEHGLDRVIDPEEYAEVFLADLERRPPDGRRVLVILDGIDEAAGWELGPELFPAAPASHVRIVVAARVLGQRRDRDGWLRHLAWRENGLAETFPLGALDRDGVADVLARMGAPLDALAEGFDAVERLYTLTRGDPLILRLYVEQLRDRVRNAADFDPMILGGLTPDLNGFFEFWFKDQRKIWGELSEQRERRGYRLLNVLSLAKGPLKRSDVSRLAPEFEQAYEINDAADDVRRFVIGDGREEGYVFSHPRLAAYFSGRLFESHERQAWAERFVDYGRRTLTELNAGRIQPENVSEYLVDYFGAHLLDANAPAADFYALVEKGWLWACERRDGTTEAFLRDARRAKQRARNDGPSAIGHEVRCLLCEASVRSLGSNVSGRLLAGCVRSGVLTLTQALVMARANVDMYSRHFSLLTLSEEAPADDSSRIVLEALAAARSVEAAHRRAEALAAVGERLPAEASEEIFQEALSAAHSIAEAGLRARALAAVGEKLPAEAREKIFQEALSAVHSIGDAVPQAKTLAAVVEKLPTEASAELFEEALGAARWIEDPYGRAVALAAVGKKLPAEERAELFKEALSAVRLIENAGPRARALAAVVEKLPAEASAELFKEALGEARWIENAGLRAVALVAVVEKLPAETSAELFEEALGAARSIENAEWRAVALAAVGEKVPAEEREDVFKEALAAVSSIADARWRALALAAAVEKLPAEEREEVFEEALFEARPIEAAGWRAVALAAVGEKLAAEASEEVFEEALSAARSIKRAKLRAWTMARVAERATASLSDDGLASLFREACELAVQDDAHRILQALAVRWADLARALGLSERQAVSQALEAFAREGRPRLLEAVAALTPVVAELGGERSLKVMTDSISEIAEWWP